mgnify:FL=1
MNWLFFSYIMTDMEKLTKGKTREGYVREMFGRIAKRYDLMNRLMTAGFDTRWRREVLRLADLQPGIRVLDMGTGTGDLTRMAIGKVPGMHVTAADFSLAMMLAGRARGELPLVAADALAAPFTDSVFDAAVSGFLMRNTADLKLALKEQIRLLKPGGRFVILDTTRPKTNLFTPFIWLHMHLVIPALGRLVTGDRQAYEYLSNSSERFLFAEDLSAAMEEAGFTNIGFKRYMFGTIAIHWGTKPRTSRKMIKSKHD